MTRLMRSLALLAAISALLPVSAEGSAVTRVASSQSTTEKAVPSLRYGASASPNPRINWGITLRRSRSAARQTTSSPFWMNVGAECEHSSLSWAGPGDLTRAVFVNVRNATFGLPYGRSVQVRLWLDVFDAVTGARFWEAQAFYSTYSTGYGYLPLRFDLNRSNLWIRPYLEVLNYEFAPVRVQSVYGTVSYYEPSWCFFR